MSEVQGRLTPRRSGSTLAAGDDDDQRTPHTAPAKVEQLMKLWDATESALRQSEGRAAKLVEAVVQEMVA